MSAGGSIPPLAYTLTGHGPPLVFLHGLTSSQARAQDAINGLANIERITIDAPAHGESKDSTVPCDFGSFAGAIADLVTNTLGVQRAIFGGISMGSGISLRIALDYPELVEGLILVRPAWVDAPGRPHLDLIADIGEWMEADGPDAARFRLSEDERYQAMLDKVGPAAASLAGVIDSVMATGRPDVLAAMVESQPMETMAELADVHQPAIVIATEHDELHPVDIAKSWADALPNGELLGSPPRYLAPVAHQTFLTAAMNDFMSQHAVATTGDQL